MGREAVIGLGLVVSWLVMTAFWGHRSQVVAFTTRSLEDVITRKAAKLKKAAQGIGSSGALKVFNSIRWPRGKLDGQLAGCCLISITRRRQEWGRSRILKVVALIKKSCFLLSSQI